MRAIVIVANGWNAGWLGCYGNEWLETPNIDRLAAESVVFDQHFISMAPESASIFRTLREYGVRTMRVHDLGDDLRTDNRWDESIAVPQSEDVSPGKALFIKIAEKLVELAKLDNWLLWIETNRLVPPWSVSMDFFDRYTAILLPSEDGPPSPPWDEPSFGKFDLNDRELDRLQGTFAAVVTEWDSELERCFDLLRKLKLDESATWIVTSNCGLSLGEHGWIGSDAERPFEETVHVPFILRLPGAASAGRRISHQTTSADLRPTLGDIFGMTIPKFAKDSSLLPLVQCSATPLHSYHIQKWTIEGREEGSLRTSEWACLLSSGERPPLLFRKLEDRWEVHNVRQQHLEWAEYLESVLRNYDPSAPLMLKDYNEVIDDSSATEDDNEHGTAGQRDDGRPEGEGGLRGHQGDEEN